MKEVGKIVCLIGVWVLSFSANAQDPNFHIYLAFGQSNMEGQGAISSEDQSVDSRFKVLQAVDCENLDRNKRTWYDAVPPLCRCWNGLSPLDYFGRTIVENTPDHIRVGVINVSIGGCRIELFDKDIYENYTDDHAEDWFQNAIAAYDGNPYGYLVDMAKVAQNNGVIKGILLHQGESNNGQSSWPSKVKTVYDNLMNDLDLDPTEVPILAGELVHEDQNGALAGMNAIINRLPETIPNAHVVSSSGCTAKSDNIHFNAEGYRMLGIRYGEKMLELLEVDSVPALGIESMDAANGFVLNQNFPNPVQDVTTLSFYVPQKSFVSLKIYDLTGTAVGVVAEKTFTQGAHEMPFDFGRLGQGVYFCVLESEGLKLSRKVFVE